jgi:hypothetical protein
MSELLLLRAALGAKRRASQARSAYDRTHGKRLWRWASAAVWANTKSEARARLKEIGGERIPAGTKIKDVTKGL